TLSTASEFFLNEPQNVGVLLGEPSGGLIDIDLDCREAVELAASLLPHTGAVFGRSSKRRSHHVYVADPLVVRPPSSWRLTVMCALARGITSTASCRQGTWQMHHLVVHPVSLCYPWEQPESGAASHGVASATSPDEGMPMAVPRGCGALDGSANGPPAV